MFFWRPSLFEPAPPPRNYVVMPPPAFASKVWHSTIARKSYNPLQTPLLEMTRRAELQKIDLEIQQWRDVLQRIVEGWNGPQPEGVNQLVQAAQGV